MQYFLKSWYFSVINEGKKYSCPQALALLHEDM
jgi:hypothetical protein